MHAEYRGIIWDHPQGPPQWPYPGVIKEGLYYKCTYVLMWVCLPLPSVCAPIPPLFLGLLLLPGLLPLYRLLPLPLPETSHKLELRPSQGIRLSLSLRADLVGGEGHHQRFQPPGPEHGARDFFPGGCGHIHPGWWWWGGGGGGVVHM